MRKIPLEVQQTTKSAAECRFLHTVTLCDLSFKWNQVIVMAAADPFTVGASGLRSIVVVSFLLLALPSCTRNSCPNSNCNLQIIEELRSGSSRTAAGVANCTDRRIVEPPLVVRAETETGGGAGRDPDTGSSRLQW